MILFVGPAVPSNSKTSIAPAVAHAATLAADACQIQLNLDKVRQSHDKVMKSWPEIQFVVQEPKLRLSFKLRSALREPPIPLVAQGGIPHKASESFR